MEAQIRKIKAIEEIKLRDEEERYFHKYDSLFKSVFTFLRKRKVLLYGGTAINELLPDKHKFYEDKTLPDIDMFTIDGKKLADDAVKYFHRKGFSNATTNAAEALHPGTYRVFVDALQILDITDISEKVFKRLSRNAVVLDSESDMHGIHVVDPQYLRMTLHLMLSKGDAGTVIRWSKVLDRIVAFYKAFPPKPCTVKLLDPNDHHKRIVPQVVYDAMYSTLHGSEYVLFGLHEIELLLNKKLDDRISFPIIQMFVDGDINVTAKEIVSKLELDNYHKKDLRISKIYPADVFLPRHLFINYRGRHVASVFDADVCEGYNEFKGYRVASIHTVIRMLLSMMLTTYGHFENYTNSLECLANTLVILSNKNRIKASNRKLIQEIVGQCYGTGSGMVTLRRNRMIRVRKNEGKNKD